MRAAVVMVSWHRRQVDRTTFPNDKACTGASGNEATGATWGPAFHKSKTARTTAITQRRTKWSIGLRGMIFGVVRAMFGIVVVAVVVIIIVVANDTNRRDR